MPKKPNLHYFLLLILFNIFNFNINSYCQQNYCDPDLPQLKNNPFGYRQRGDRCEGRYIQQVASTTLQIVSFTKYVEDYNVRYSNILLVKWHAPFESAIHVRAQGIKRRLYYRMDTVRPPGDTIYIWPLDVLSPLGIQVKEIGIVGWMKHNFDGIERDIFVPLSVGQKLDSINSNNYKILLLPGQELEEVYYSLAQIGDDGIPKKYIRDSKPLGYGYYPAEVGISIFISDLESPGIYYLLIGVTLKKGGSSTIQIWFYHTKD